MIMKKQILTFSTALTLLTALGSCGTPMRVVDIQRSRIVIDKTYDATPDAQAAAFIKPYQLEVDSMMKPVVGRVAHQMAASRPESNLSNLLTDILMWGAQKYNETPQLAVYNMGGIRAALAAGEVTYGDVIDVAPFENKICFLTLKGSDLLELFSQMAVRHGEGVSKGVALVITKDGQLVSARLNGEPIDAAASYRLATLDYLAQGNDGMEAFKKGTQLVSPSAEENNVRFVIMDYFREQQKQGKAVSASVEGRIVEQ